MASSTSKEHLQTAKSPVISSTEEVVSRPVTAAPESGADAGNPTSPLTEEKPRQVEDAQAAKTAKGNAGQVTSPVLTTSRGAGRKGHRQKARAQMGLQAVAPLSQPVTAEAAASGPVAAEKVIAQPDTAEPVQAQPEPAAETAMPASAVANENLRQAENTFAVDLEGGEPVAVLSAPMSSLSPLTEGRKGVETPTAWREWLPFLARVMAAVLWHVYLATAISLTWNSAPDFCHDVKFLTLVTCAAYPFVLWQAVTALLEKSAKGAHVRERVRKVVHSIHDKFPTLLPRLWLSMWMCVAVFVIVDAMYDRYRLTSLNGIVVLILIGYTFSKNRDCVSWYPVMSGLMLQFLLGLCVLRWSTGRDALRCLSAKMENFLGYTTHGSFFVFGHLASGWNLTDALGDLASLMPHRDLEAHEPRDIRPLLPVFVFQVLPVIFFFSLFVNILYFYGIMQWVVVRLGGFLQLTMGTTVCESTTAAANIFLGQV
ncbi:hypothetical protein V5799_020005 [Amblyomma americanum]|uniref:Transmembrane protein n=1 Tax=Amblyomma americanum TaxID=6943 RepID=A0AAQ4EVN2_AMBAM